MLQFPPPTQTFIAKVQLLRSHHPSFLLVQNSYHISDLCIMRTRQRNFQTAPMQWTSLSVGPTLLNKLPTKLIQEPPATLVLTSCPSILLVLAPVNNLVPATSLL